MHSEMASKGITLDLPHNSCGNILTRFTPLCILLGCRELLTEIVKVLCCFQSTIAIEKNVYSESVKLA